MADTVDLLKKLQDLKKQEKELQEKSIRLDTQIETNMKALKEEFGCSSIEEAQEKLQELDEAITKEQADLEKDIAAFKEQNQWK